MKTLRSGILGLGLLAAAPVWAGEANVVAPFLQNGVGGRPAGMADCYAAVAEGPFGSWYNPAALGLSRGLEAGFQYEAMGFGVVHNSLAGTFPLGSGGMGVLLNSFTYGSLEKWDETGALTGESLNPSDTLLAAGYGLPVGESWRLGANAGVYSTDLGAVRWAGAVADLGGMWDMDSHWSAAAVLKNLGSGYDGFRLPASLRLGGVFRGLRQRLLVCAELDIPLSPTTMDVGLGAEYRIWNWLDARLGYKGALAREGSRDNLTLGLGFNLGNFGLDLSFMSRGDFGYRNSLTLNYALGRPYRPLPAPAGEAQESRLPPPRPDAEGTDHLQPDTGRQAEYHYQAGKEYEHYGRTIDAIIEYKAALKLRPDYPEAYAALAAATDKAKLEVAGRDKGKPESAAGNSTLQKSIRKHYELGVNAYNSREYNTAIKELQLVLELTSQHQEATELLHKAEAALKGELTVLRAQAESARQKNDLTGEILACQKMLDLDPANSAVEAKLKAAQKKIPGAVERLYKLGLDQYAKAQYRQALKCFESVLKLQPDHVKAKDAVRNIKEKLVQTGQ